MIASTRDTLWLMVDRRCLAINMATRGRIASLGSIKFAGAASYMYLELETGENSETKGLLR